MTRTRVKVCCVRSRDEALMAIAAGADAIGMVGVTPPNPRSISDREIAEIVLAVPPPVASVLLTTEHRADRISAQVRRTNPTAVQILSPIEPTELACLAELHPALRRIQVVHVQGFEALDLIPKYEPVVHAFLLDSGRPHAPRPEFGGTGRPHDWAVSAKFVEASRLPVFLAGGLSAANAAQAISQVRPFGLDLCSGVRTEGRLDFRKLANFLSAVRTCN